MAPTESNERDGVGRQEALERRVDELETKVERQAETISHLRARLRWYENPNTPPSKRFPGGPGGADTDDDGPDDPTSSGSTDDNEEGNDTDADTGTNGATTGNEADESSSADAETTDSEDTTRGRNEGHDGTTRTLPDPDRTVRVDESYCPHCGCTLTDPDDYASHTVIDVPHPIPTEVVEYELGVHDCCGTTVTAEHPDCPETGDYGPHLLTLAALFRHHSRLPHRKQAEQFAWLFDHELSHATIYNMLDRVAEQLRPAYEAVNDQLRQREVVNVDETGYPVDGDQHWLWAFVTDEEVLYHLAEGRGSSVLESVLGEEFAVDAVLGADGWTAYPAFHDRIQRCWAHLLREAEFVAARDDEAEPFAEELHAIYEEVTAFVDGDPSAAARKRRRNAAAQRLESLATGEYDAEQVQQLATKLEHGLGFWLTFLTHPGVPSTNNRAERAVREQVVQRKVFGGLRSERGEFIHETLTTMLATWNQRGLDPPKQLLSMLGGRDLATQAADAPERPAAEAATSDHQGEASPA